MQSFPSICHLLICVYLNLVFCNINKYRVYIIFIFFSTYPKALQSRGSKIRKRRGNFNYRERQPVHTYNKWRNLGPLQYYSINERLFKSRQKNLSTCLLSVCPSLLFNFSKRKSHKNLRPICKLCIQRGRINLQSFTASPSKRNVLIKINCLKTDPDFSQNPMVQIQILKAEARRLKKTEIQPKI